jgi:hypothetical protein
MKTRPLCVVLLLASFHCSAHAQYFKCTDANGRTSIQDSPCPQDPKAPERKRPVAGTRDEDFARRSKETARGGNWEAGRTPLQALPSAQPLAGAGPGATSGTMTGRMAELERKREMSERLPTIDPKSMTPAACKQARRQLELLNSDRPSILLTAMAASVAWHRKIAKA